MKHSFLILILLNITIVKCQQVIEGETKNSAKNQTNAIALSSNDVTFISLWSRASATFLRPNADRSGKFFYQAVLITVETTGVYTIRCQSYVDTFGYLYSPSFNQKLPNQDLIESDDNSGGSQQFRIDRTLTVNRRYYLVITTRSPSVTGKFTIRVSGPTAVDVIPITGPFVFAKNLDSVLDSANPMFQRPSGFTSTYFYSVIRVVVKTTGLYSFQSTSSFDTYGLLYYPKFNKASPSSNLLQSDDDSAGGGQFNISYKLIADNRYFLVVTSFQRNTIGMFGVNATGPSLFDLTEVTGITTFNSTLSSTFNRNDQRFSRPNAFSSNTYYYKLFRIVPKKSVYYAFRRNSGINVVGYLYGNNFNPFDPLSNLMNYLDFNTEYESSLLLYLQAGAIYYLVMTTSQMNSIGDFTIRATGRATLQFISISTSQSATNNISSSLTLNTTRFRRFRESGNFFYYRVFRLTISTSGLYSIRTTGYVDTFGYIYRSSFNSASPGENLVAEDDQSGDKNQFRLGLVLDRNVTYYLVVTTFREYTFGSFKIVINGPTKVNIIARRQITSR